MLSGSIGTSFAEHSPAFVALIGFQHTLSWPLLFHRITTRRVRFVVYHSVKRPGLLENTSVITLSSRRERIGEQCMIGTVCETGRSGPGARVLEMMLPRDHLLRRVDRLLDLGELRSALAPHYSPRGRPSVDPELLIRMALIGRIYAITSERRLCEEVRYNLAYRWFCRLPAGAAVPHHSTFSKKRHGRFREAGVFRLLFENTVRRCIAAGLVSAKDAAIDASFVAADASWQRKMALTQH